MWLFVAAVQSLVTARPAGDSSTSSAMPDRPITLEQLRSGDSAPPADLWIRVILCRDYNCDSTAIRLRSDYDVSRAPA